MNAQNFLWELLGVTVKVWSTRLLAFIMVVYKQCFPSYVEMNLIPPFQVSTVP